MLDRVHHREIAIPHGIKSSGQILQLNTQRESKCTCPSHEARSLGSVLHAPTMCRKKVGELDNKLRVAVQDKIAACQVRGAEGSLSMNSAA